MSWDGITDWLLIVCMLGVSPFAEAQERFRVSYGGFNETATSMWVGIERGMFKKYGIDAQMVQVRNGALSIATLVAKEVEAVWPAQSTILSTVSGGIKLTCIGGPVNKIPRNLMVRKELKGAEDLRGKTVGVQSIGGGLWLQTMIILDHLGVDPDKYGIKVRVIGDEATLAQAMITNNIDFGVITYGLSETLYSQGFKSLIDARRYFSSLPGAGNLRAERIRRQPERILLARHERVGRVRCLHPRRQ